MHHVRHGRRGREARVITRMFAALAIFTLAPASVSADDSSAELGAGGLVLTHSDQIRLADEVLRISPTDVSARFIFINDSRADIDTIVAFPLPDIDTSRFSEEPLGRTNPDPVNFVGFKVSENGRNIPFSVEQRAFYKGRDVTETIRRAGVPLNIVDPGFARALESLPAEKYRSLSAADLIDRESGSFAHPHWLVRTKFWWRQQFPAGKPITLEERYRPVTGESLIGQPELSTGGDSGQYWLRTYCIDPKTRAAALTMLMHNRTNPRSGNLLTALATDYVLSTGNNWKGPIGRFQLILDKLKPDNLLSLCWDDALNQAGPTLFGYTRANFAPKGDIRLLVLQKGPL